MAITPGDVVALRAGGPPMNVRSVSEKYALCSWFDLEGQRHIEVFRLDALVVVHELPEPPAPDGGRDRSP